MRRNRKVENIMKAWRRIKVKWSRTGLIYRQYVFHSPTHPARANQFLSIIFLSHLWHSMLIFFNQAQKESNSNVEKNFSTSIENFPSFPFSLLLLPSIHFLRMLINYATFNLKSCFVSLPSSLLFFQLIIFVLLFIFLLTFLCLKELSIHEK